MQRELPFRMTADVSYVGNSTTNVPRNIPINNLTPEQLTDPANLDPTQNNTQLKGQDYLRPYMGFAGINELQYFGEGVTYHSIQVGVTRRFSNGFGGSVAYTGSRSFGLRGWDWYRTDADNEARFRTANGSRPHNLVFGYNYEIPGLSQHMNDNVIAKGVFDGWQISGVSTLQGGTRGGFTYAFTGAPTGDLTQGLGGSRVVLDVRSEPAARRADVRTAVPHRVRPSAGTVDRSG